MQIVYRNQYFNRNKLDSWLDNTLDLSSIKSIAVIMNRSPELIWLLYKAYCLGVTFIPIDPKENKEKINYILDQTQPDVVICNDKKYEYKKKHSHNYDNVAYVLYTSGTTGGAKGVMVKRNSLDNFISGVSELIEFNELKKIASFTSVSFDIFLLESIMAISKNMTIILADDIEQNNPRAITRLLLENKVDIVQLTPSRLQMLLNYDPELKGLETIKDVLIGGEALSINLLTVLQQKTSARIFNMYGPTETTIWSTIAELTDSDSVNIGYPIKNTEIFIVDNELNILPTGARGEICIAGEGLAQGYLNNDKLTSEKFVLLPTKGIKVYKTGDYGKKRNDGVLEWCGRIDNQIKLRGHRIELEEIESTINQYEGIIQSIVGVHDNEDYVQELYAFYSSNKNIDMSEMRKYLEEKLPDYMVPNKIEGVDCFKQNINGKIDRQYYASLFNENNKSLSSDCIIDNRVLQIIKENSSSNETNIDFNSSFKDIGYDSISFIKTIIALEYEFNFEFEDAFLLLSNYRTIGDMVKYVNDRLH